MRVKCVSVSRSCPRPTGGGTVRPSPLSITLLDLSPWTSSKHRAQLADAVRAGRGRRQPRRDDSQHLARRVPRRLAGLRGRARRRNRRGALPASPPQADEQLVEVRPRVAGSGTGSRLCARIMWFIVVSLESEAVLVRGRGVRARGCLHFLGWRRCGHRSVRRRRIGCRPRRGRAAR